MIQNNPNYTPYRNQSQIITSISSLLCGCSLTVYSDFTIALPWIEIVFGKSEWAFIFVLNKSPRTWKHSAQTLTTGNKFDELDRSLKSKRIVSFLIFKEMLPLVLLFFCLWVQWPTELIRLDKKNIRMPFPHPERWSVCGWIKLSAALLGNRNSDEREQKRRPHVPLRNHWQGKSTLPNSSSFF